MSDPSPTQPSLGLPDESPHAERAAAPAEAALGPAVPVATLARALAGRVGATGVPPELRATLRAHLDTCRSAHPVQRDAGALLRAAAQAVTTLGYAYVSIYERRGPALELQVEVGHAMNLPSVPVEHGVLGRVVRLARPVLVADPSTDPDYVATTRAVTSEICVPLLRSGQVAGVLNVETVGEPRLTPEDLGLLEAMGELISEALSPRAAAAGAAPPRPRVLLAEDEPMNQRLIRLYLDRLGYDAVVVSTGEAAVAAAREHAYALILMDARMPGMDGLEAARWIRSRQDHRPWIIAITAGGAAEEREACRRAGMDDLLCKPFLLDDLERALRRQPVRPPPAAPAPPTPAAATAAVRATPTATTDEGPVDFSTLESLRDRLGEGGHEAVVRLAATYRESSELAAAALRRQGGSGDSASVRHAAHTLKSASAAVGARRLALMCGRLETDVGQGTPPVVEEILREIEAVRAALEAWARPA